MNNNSRKAFSIIELSVVILTVGLLIAGITKGKSLVNKFNNIADEWQVYGYSYQANSIEALYDDMELWLDASNIDGDSNSTLSNNNTIATWNDLSGNNRHATAPSGRQPIFISSDNNGNNAVLFTRDRMTAQSGVGISENKPRTMIMVFRSIATVGSSELFGTGTGQMIDVGTHLSSNNLRVRNSDNIWSNSGTILLNTDYILLVSHEESKLLASANNFEIINEDPSDYFNYTLDIPVGIGWSGYDGREFVNGYIREVLVFDKVLLSSEIDLVHRYLSQKWDIALVN